MISAGRQKKMDNRKMSNLQFENTWVCVSLPRIESWPGNTWVSYAWKRLADLDFCADVDGRIIAVKDKSSNDYYSAMKPVLGDAADVKIEQLDARNPFELVVSLELHGLLLDGSKT